MARSSQVHKLNTHGRALGSLVDTATNPPTLGRCEYTHNSGPNDLVVQCEGKFGEGYFIEIDVLLGGSIEGTFVLDAAFPAPADDSGMHEPAAARDYIVATGGGASISVTLVSVGADSFELQFAFSAEFVGYRYVLTDGHPNNPLASGDYIAYSYLAKENAP